MILLAMAFGPPIEILIVFLMITLMIGIFIFLIIARLFFNKLTFSRILLISIIAPVLLITVLFVGKKIYDFINSPMSVRKYNIEGDYVINRKMFSGKNCDWQYEHYTIHIDRDTLYLNILNNSKLIKTYKRPIFYVRRGKHTFFEFHNYWQIRFAALKEIENYSFDYIDDKYIDNMNPDQTYIREQIEKETDSIRTILYDSIVAIKRDSAIHYVEHHMLKLNPLLHADPFMFNVVLRSTKYGNMFFRKGKWKEEY